MRLTSYSQFHAVEFQYVRHRKAVSGRARVELHGAVSVSADENVSDVVFEAPKLAVPVGTIAGDQWTRVKSELPGAEPTLHSGRMRRSRLGLRQL